jgi:hypothetical protein
LSLASHDQGITDSPDEHYLSFEALFRSASLVFVLGIVFYIFFYSLNGNQPNSTAFYFTTYSLMALSAALASGGIVQLVKHREHAYDWSTAGKVLASAVAGIVLMLISAPFPPYGIFEITYTGFPLPFISTTSLVNETFTTTDPLAFAADCLFWILLVYPAVWFASSVLKRTIRATGPLDAVGLSAFLTYGTYPAWRALVSVGIINGVFESLGPVSILVFFYLADGTLSLLLALRGYRRLGLLLALAGLPFVFLLGLAGLASLSHIVL